MERPKIEDFTIEDGGQLGYDMAVNKYVNHIESTIKSQDRMIKLLKLSNKMLERKINKNGRSNRM